MLATLVPFWCVSAGFAGAAAPCRISRLSAAVDTNEAEQVDPGLGHHAVTIAIQNHSSSPCLLRGIPMLTLSDTGNHAFTVRACPNCGDYLFRVQPVNDVLLEPNRSAYVVVGYNINDGAGNCREPAILSLYVEGQRKPLRMAARMISSCGPINITPLLGEPPVEGFLPDPNVPRE